MDVSIRITDPNELARFRALYADLSTHSASYRNYERKWNEDDTPFSTAPGTR